MTLVFMTLRKISIIGLIACLAVLGIAHYLEYQYMLAACPLCMLQRIIFACIAGVFFVGSIINFSRWPSYAYSGMLIFLSLIGMGIAGRQIWLQYFAPPQSVSCAASLQRLFEIYPWFDSLKIILQGSAECATIDFTILGLSIAAWSFILFLLIASTMIVATCLQKKRQI